jgi:WD40 repeat protein
VVGSRDRFIRLWDLSTEKEVRVLDGSQRAAAVSRSDADGTIGTFTTSNPRDVVFAIANDSDAPQEQNSRSLSKYWQTVTSLAISPNGKTLYSGSRDGAVKQWDLNTGKAVKAFCGN